MSINTYTPILHPGRRVSAADEQARVRARANEEIELWADAAPLCEYVGHIADRAEAELGLHVETSGALGRLTHGCIVIEVILREDESIDQCLPIVKWIRTKRAFKAPTESAPDKDDPMPSMSWIFHPADTADGPAFSAPLMLRCWFGKSNVCRLVETGEMRPVMRVDCSGKGE